MIVIKIEMWPGGHESRKRPLGEIQIANIGGADDRGDYEVRLMKSVEYTRRPGVWRRAIVRGFPRRKLGQYDLLFRALAACIGPRNREAAEIAERGETIETIEAAV